MQRSDDATDLRGMIKIYGRPLDGTKWADNMQDTLKTQVGTMRIGCVILILQNCVTVIVHSADMSLGIAETVCNLNDIC